MTTIRVSEAADEFTEGKLGPWPNKAYDSEIPSDMALYSMYFPMRRNALYIAILINKKLHNCEIHTRNKLSSSQRSLKRAQRLFCAPPTDHPSINLFNQHSKLIHLVKIKVVFHSDNRNKNYIFSFLCRVSAGNKIMNTKNNSKSSGKNDRKSSENVKRNTDITSELDNLAVGSPKRRNAGLLNNPAKINKINGSDIHGKYHNPKVKIEINKITIIVLSDENYLSEIDDDHSVEKSSSSIDYASEGATVKDGTADQALEGKTFSLKFKNYLTYLCLYTPEINIDDAVSSRSSNTSGDDAKLSEALIEKYRRKNLGLIPRQESLKPREGAEPALCEINHGSIRHTAALRSSTHKRLSEKETSQQSCSISNAEKVTSKKARQRNELNENEQRFEPLADSDRYTLVVFNADYPRDVINDTMKKSIQNWLNDAFYARMNRESNLLVDVNRLSHRNGCLVADDIDFNSLDWIKFNLRMKNWEPILGANIEVSSTDDFVFSPAFSIWVPDDKCDFDFVKKIVTRNTRGAVNASEWLLFREIIEKGNNSSTPGKKFAFIADETLRNTVNNTRQNSLKINFNFNPQQAQIKCIGGNNYSRKSIGKSTIFAKMGNKITQFISSQPQELRTETLGVLLKFKKLMRHRSSTNSTFVLATELTKVWINNRKTITADHDSGKSQPHLEIKNMKTCELPYEIIIIAVKSFEINNELKTKKLLLINKLKYFDYRKSTGENRNVNKIRIKSINYSAPLEVYLNDNSINLIDSTGYIKLIMNFTNLPLITHTIHLLKHNQIINFFKSIDLYTGSDKMGLKGASSKEYG